MMEGIREFFLILINNKLFMSAVIGWVTAQVLKTLIHLLMTKEFHAERLVG